MASSSSACSASPRGSHRLGIGFFLGLRSGGLAGRLFRIEEAGGLRQAADELEVARGLTGILQARLEADAGSVALAAGAVAAGVRSVHARRPAPNKEDRSNNAQQPGRQQTHLSCSFDMAIIPRMRSISMR